MASMAFPARAQAIVDEMWRRHRDLAVEDEDKQRELTRMIGEQLAFELGPQWGVKRGGPGRPQGPSAVAFNGPPLHAWRWSDGDGHVTGVPFSPLHPPLDQGDIPDQTFIPCEPINHLAIQAIPLPVDAPADHDPRPLSDTDEIAGLVTKLDILTQRLNVLTDTVGDLTLSVKQLTARITELRQSGIRLRL